MVLLSAGRYCFILLGGWAATTARFRSAGGNVLEAQEY
jgi:hypothetical protein